MHLINADYLGFDSMGGLRLRRLLMSPAIFCNFFYSIFSGFLFEFFFNCRLISLIGVQYYQFNLKIS